MKKAANSTPHYTLVATRICIEMKSRLPKTVLTIENTKNMIETYCLDLIF